MGHCQCTNVTCVSGTTVMFYCNACLAFGPGNGSPIATDVDDDVVVVLVVGTKAFSFHNRSSLNFIYT